MLARRGIPGQNQSPLPPIAKVLVDAEIEMREIPVSVDGGVIRTRLYRLRDSSVRSGVLWMHGGGFVGGSIDMPEGHATSIALARTGVAVLSVNYRSCPRPSCP